MKVTWVSCARKHEYGQMEKTLVLHPIGGQPNRLCTVATVIRLRGLIKYGRT
jgi:hypothetical protein